MTYCENSHNIGNIFGTFIAESNKNITFTFDMTSHASRRTAHPGRSSSFYIIALIGLADKTDYTKRPLTFAEQVARLKQRGLVFDDENEAIAYLFNISYYLYYIANSDRQLFTFCISLKIF